MKVIEECTIIIPTNSKYLDVCNSFLQLMDINWKENSFQRIISECGEHIESPVEKTLYNGKNATLTECVLAAANKFPSKYYIVLLGDAFISKKVDNHEIEELLWEISEFKIDYCQLMPKKIFGKTQRVYNLMRYARKNERYSHSFVAFIASQKFIQEEFGNGITDRDFEIKYLKEAAMTTPDDIYYKNDAILLKNIFHIMPGIEKGKWDRIAWNYLTKHYPEILFPSREKISVGHEIFLQCRAMVLPFIPNRLLRKAKKMLSPIIGKWIDTED